MISAFMVLHMSLLWSQAKTQSQPEVLQTTTLGATLHVKCQAISGPRTLVWYKQDTSRKLQLMASVNTRKKKRLSTDVRYSVQYSESDSTMSVSNVTWEDAGTYYCGVMNERDVDFRPGTVVVVEGKSKPRPVAQSPEYIRVQPGDSVTLRCSFTTRLCPRKHIRVRWKKMSSASDTVSESVGYENMICENQNNTSCVHYLTIMTNISSAEDGTYLCVVAACGDTLLGTGSKIHLYNFKRPSGIQELAKTEPSQALNAC